MKHRSYKKIFFIPVVFLFINASPYDAPKFVTLPDREAKFPIHGKIEKVSRYEDISEAPISIRESNYWSVVTFKEAGFYGLTVTENGQRQFYSIFVSPIPTIHADKAVEEINWYQTQFNSGTLSNCGPASAAMAISWSTGRYFSTAMVRDAVGWKGDGATSFEDLIKVIKTKNDTAKIVPLKRFDQIKNVIDSGGIAIVVFKTDGVASNKKNPEKFFFDKYYVDNVGHYIIVKGYSKDGEYLVVNDPIPSDWYENKFRHSDGISMIGKNRYYKTSELLSSLRRNDMIAVMRNR
ncbi:MAG: hypothetical protein Ta2B_27370 [Termitinemataceae bacterium]|nr:MAG: hypothetical protein Ta2B_27370 [Termitinemataceae bacterium]